MDYIRLRRLSIDQLSLFVMVISIAMAICFFLLNVAYQEDRVLFTIVLIVELILFLIPLTIVLLVSLYEFLTVIKITHNDITISYPFSKEKVIKREDVSAFGLMYFPPMDYRVFICTESKANIIQFYQENIPKCEKMFGRKRMKQFQETDYNCWRMASAVYARYKNKAKMIYLYSLSREKMLEQIELLWKESPINTGLVLNED